MAMSENTRKVLDYLKGIGSEDVTSADVANYLGIPKKTVDGCFTLGLQKKGLGVRVESEVVDAEGATNTIKFLKLTDEGKNFDPDAEVAAD